MNVRPVSNRSDTFCTVILFTIKECRKLNRGKEWVLYTTIIYQEFSFTGVIISFTRESDPDTRLYYRVRQEEDGEKFGQ